MKKFSLYIIIDFLFKFLLLFTINLIWTLYFIQKAWICILLSGIIAVLIIFLFNFFSSKKQAKNNIKLKEKKYAQDVKDTFILMSQKNVVEFFYELAKSKHEAVKLSKYVLINNQTILLPNIKNRQLDIDELIDLYNQVNKKNINKIIILCNNFNPNIEKILYRFDTKTIVLDFNQTYNLLLKKYDIFPKLTTKDDGKAKSTFKQIIISAFDKKKTRGYVVSAMFIIFSSFFVTFRVYYLIVATILLIFALLCQFEQKFNKPSNENLLD